METVLTDFAEVYLEDENPSKAVKPVAHPTAKISNCTKWTRLLADSNCWKGMGWWVAIFPLTCIMIWSMAYILFGSLAFPGGSIFALALLELLAIILGHVAELVCLPPMFGMVTAGLLLRNLPILSNIGMDLDPSVTNPLRAMSVVVLLTRGAFNVNPSLIIKHKWVIPQLYIGSCVMEAVAAGSAAYFLIGWPVQWCAALGCIYSAMTGSGVMPYLLRLEKNKLGLEHNVMTIAKQASGLDAILAISLTELGYGFIFADGDLVGGLEKGALEVVYGFLFGICWGGVAGIVFEEENNSALRTFIVFSGGSMSLLGLTKIGYPRGGPVGSFFGALVVACIWRHKSASANDKVSIHFTRLWYFFQPLLFGIIGSRVDFFTVNWTLIISAILCLVISMSVRMCATFSMLTFAEDMTPREKFFIVLAWLPKGTVQAALGPVALETALSTGLKVTGMAYDLLTISTTVIVLGSLIGPIALLSFAPKFLKRV